MIACFSSCEIDNKITKSFVGCVAPQANAPYVFNTILDFGWVIAVCWKIG
ncbi:hypothetical protein FDUTEX481_02422 [Tolypothrix sp. PCC 7601]|nr:hypothetical protein FDUTEX481_02422 [Tolypothrix sp. PCC 7601]